MGTSSSKKASTDDKFKTQYIAFLKKKQKRFIRQERRNNTVRPNGIQFSFISEAGDESVDWKVFFDDFLEQHSDTCFWAPPMLQ